MRNTCTVFVLLSVAAMLWAGPPKGKPVTIEAEDQKALDNLKGKIHGKIVWSSSRTGNHKIHIMNADGTDEKLLTHADKTDWFSRFSPDGEQVIFTRSKMNWTPEPDADKPAMWDTWMIRADGTEEKLLIPNSTWATWRPDGKDIVFARGGQVFLFNVATGTETRIADGETILKKGVVLQNPHLSPDGKFLAITLRGSMRETGILDLSTQVWTKVGEGCQINWFAKGDRVVRMNSTGNGGSEVLSFYVKDGKPVKADASIEEQRFIDLPGRRSHEYFPQMSKSGQWLVWCATQRGHDHDIADYEMQIWDIATPPEQAVRLTFHSGNDRWPDLFLNP